MQHVNAISRQPDEPLWQDYRHYTAAQLPQDIRHWLLDQGSLTQRLIRASHGQFRVEVLRQQWQRPKLSERTLLSMAARETAIIREVLLLCHDQPWVFARSVIPASSLQGRLRRLRHFDNSSLGAMLFSDPSMQRKPFQVAQVPGDNPQLPPSQQQAEPLWGRRSRFELINMPIMVSEIFLPAFRP